MDKSDLRKLYLQKRKAISVEKASKIHENFELFLPQEIQNVHIFLPIANKAEIDTWPIIRYLWSKNIQVIVPKMGSKSMMSSWQLTPETKLVENAWKVPEPVDAESADNDSIDMVVLPLLAYDRHGNRVGYGKGYYDRFLNSIKRKVLKVGLSYFPPADEIPDVDPWEVPLDYCITPEGVIKF